MTPRTLDYPDLGQLTWDGDCTWSFDPGVISGHPTIAIIIAEQNPIPDKRWLEIIRHQLRYVRENEAALRDHVAREMFGWWVEAYYDEEEDDIRDPEGFRDAIHISGFNFYESGQVRVWYDDVGLVGNHGIWIELRLDGSVSDGPDIV